jgi:hypothetical protein
LPNQWIKSDFSYCILSNKNVSRIRKKTFYLQFGMGTPKGHQKSIFNISKVKKKTKIHMGSIRHSLPALRQGLGTIFKKSITVFMAFETGFSAQ